MPVRSDASVDTTHDAGAEATICADRVGAIRCGPRSVCNWNATPPLPSG